MRNTSKTILQASFVLLLAGCTKTQTSENEIILNQKSPAATQLVDGQADAVEVYMAEYITDLGSQQIGQTVFFKDVGNKQLGADFVPGDPRKGGRVNITYAVDNGTTSDNGLNLAQTTAAIDNAMATWDAENCSDLNMTKIPYGGNLGYYSALLGFGGNGAFVADVQHSGFLPAAFFNALAPGGGSFILGVTFTLVFTSGGVPTDIDRNGLPDVAFREIYYNDAFTWRTNSGNGVDLETIALHEAGHGLSQAHFGKAFVTNANDKLHFAPRAVMNAAYAGIQRSLLGTDGGGHCSNWASWPNK